MASHRAFGTAIEQLDVVVVDDSRAMQGIVNSMLQAMRVARSRFFDGAEAAYLAMRAECPDLVITDWRMAPASGYQLLRAMRHRGAAPLCFVPVIMISGHTNQTLVEQALLAGAHGFIAKPIAPITLRRMIESILVDRRDYILEGDHYVLAGAAEALPRAKAEQGRVMVARTGPIKRQLPTLPMPPKRQPETPRELPREPMREPGHAPRGGYGALIDAG